MARAISEATQLRTAKAELVRARKELAESERLCAGYRSRATKAEQECAEWKARFDILLRREEMKR